MAFSYSTINGAVVTGLTTPGFTMTVDSAPNSRSKQHYVSALTGTQTGATAHSLSSPFTASVFLPAVIRTLAAPSPITGVVRDVPNNVFKDIIRKGVTPAAGQTTRVAMRSCSYSIPAGCETYDAANLASFLAFAGGFSYAAAQWWYDTMRTGAL